MVFHHTHRREAESQHQWWVVTWIYWSEDCWLELRATLARRGRIGESHAYAHQAQAMLDLLELCHDQRRGGERGGCGYGGRGWSQRLRLHAMRLKPAVVPLTP
ncbi:hypothetical protein Salat_1094200 [Sesamum alatum]|uniref:Uncharacterized protein n=1 Tax=Sesamum alatum TaxID=300844 RepID=A0AAE1YMV4_9LAMI|nr:hypothetical protein Salat_1094200 [Sesamum alatum]